MTTRTSLYHVKDLQDNSESWAPLSAPAGTHHRVFVSVFCGTDWSTRDLSDWQEKDTLLGSLSELLTFPTFTLAGRGEYGDISGTLQLLYVVSEMLPKRFALHH